jgi:hypothetical protein
MVTVVKTPQGHKIIDQAITATVTNSSGDALVNFTAHGLSTGSYVYIDSDIDEYNGFWYVTSINANTFKISEHSAADFVEYYQSVEISYYQTQSHDWSSIFLPIVYKATNDRWPTNTVDTARTISSTADDNGFTEMTLSGAIKSGDVNALEFVIIEDAADDDLNGIWQIVEVITSSNIVLNLPYSSGNSFAGATIHYYYNNYQVRVKIFAGLDASHPWTNKKPYHEVAELSLTPDENGEVMFSVSDYIKSNVTVRNNLTLYSLPLNLDFFTGFYIATAESYDYSDNYTIGTAVSDYTQDMFEGYAIAGKLPFKNVYSGDYADYVYTSGSPALWLTNMDRLIAVEGKYFDVSFIKNIIGTFFIKYSWYVQDYLTLVEDIQMTDSGIGVYRIPVEVNSAYDSVCIQAYKSATTSFTPAEMPPFDEWEDLEDGEVAWDGDSVDFNDLGLSVTSNTRYTDYAFEAGQIYTFAYQMSAGSSPGCGSMIIKIYDAGMVELSSVTIPGTTSPQSGTYEFAAPTGAAGIGIIFFQSCSCGSPEEGFCVRTLDSFTNETTGGDTEPAFAITEEICIDILESCEIAEGFSPEDRRLLEDGDYRLLE